MTKGYWIARVDVDDPEAYKEYVATASPAFVEFEAKFLARGGECQGIEGQSRGRNVIIEFSSYETALACYNSETYQKAKAIRQRCSTGEIVIVKGAG